jgi:hypothetical protein
MHEDALAALVAAGMEDNYARLIADDSPIRIWRLTNSERERARRLVPTYQLEVPLTIGQAWSSEISEQAAVRVKAALDRAGVGYLTEL